MATETMATDLNLRDPEWLAEQLGIEKNTLYKYLNDGLIPGLRLGKKWLVDPSDIREFLAAERRRQTLERRAQVWLLSEILRVSQEGSLPAAKSIVVTPALMADTLRAVEYQCQQHGYRADYIPDVAALMKEVGLYLEPCNQCKALPVLFDVDDPSEPLCGSCARKQAEASMRKEVAIDPDDLPFE